MEISYDYSKFDFDKPITREHLDLEIYNNKFKYVDQYRSMKTPDKSMLNTIWNDVTMFSYMFLRLDGRPLRLYPYQDIILNDPYRFKYFEAANQIGKAQMYGTTVLTKDGFVKIEDINVGDIVYDRFGKECNVIGVPFDGYDECYDLTFKDGSNIQVSQNHLWITKTNKERFRKKYHKGSRTWDNPSYDKWGVYDTEQMYVSSKKNIPAPYNRCSIPITESIDFKDKKLIFNPYILGLMIGDGTYNTGYSYSSGDYELAKYVSDYSKQKIRTMNSNTYVVSCGSFKRPFEKLKISKGLSDTKFIPKDYLHSSINQRKELLKGLMDTDGSVYGKYANLEYCTVSKRLKDDFVYLIKSLGYIVNKVSEKSPFYYDKDRTKVFGKKAYAIRFRGIESPFNLKRKTDKFIPIVAHKHENILYEIKPISRQKCKCITVDSYDNSYIAQDFIVTHNSISLDVQSVFDFTHDNQLGFNTAIVSKSLPQATHQMRRIKSLLNSTKFEWKANKGEADNMSVISLDVLNDNNETIYTNYLIVAPSSEGLLGYDLHDLNLDEFEFWDNDTRYFFEQIAEPRTYHTKGNVTIFSNPNGADSFGAELTKVTLPDGTKKFHVYNFNFLDKPGNTQEDLDMAAAGKERQVVESTLLAVRSISDRNYFSRDEIENSYDPNLNELKMVGEHPFAFLDVGAKKDQSCLGMGYVKLLEGYDNSKSPTDKQNWPYIELSIPVIHLYPVGYPISRVVGASSNTHLTDGWHYEKSVKEHISEWSKDGIVPTFGCDVTGNSGISPLFQSIGLYPKDVTFTGPSKSGYWQRFKYMLELGLLHRIKHVEWESQAAQVIVTKSARGYLLINSAGVLSGGAKAKQKGNRIPDDTLDMTAGLIALADPQDSTEANFEMI